MDSSQSDSLKDKYCEKDCDEISKSWRKILDLEAINKEEPDWYSTRTFQVFLDALDINSPVSQKSVNDKGSSKSQSNPDCSKDGSPVDEISPTKTNNLTYDVAETKSSQGVETILSAEALKILSELPDLSHMSARSFMFPRQSKR